MSKKTNPESHQKSKKSESSNKSVAIIIILCFLGAMPILIWATLPESSPYTTVTTTSAMVDIAAYNAGLETCSSNPITVNVAGATSAVLHTLSPTCGSRNAASDVQVLVVGFSDTNAQMAALADAQATHSNWKLQNTEAYITGSTVLVVQGAPGNTEVQDIGASFIEQGAVQVI